MLDLHAYVPAEKREDAIRLLDSTRLIVAGFATLVVQRYLGPRRQR
jgi:hypothetical protein